jgi:ParB family chromosome partitioning protein
MSSKNPKTTPVTWLAHEVELSSIRDNRRPVRDIDTAAVSSLAESMELVGQLSPILLTTDREVIFGRQRIAAQRARGASTIRAVVVDLSEVLARVATLDENLCRAELTAFQRAELLAERKALYEQLHPDSRHGAAKGEHSATGFTRSMAQLTGRGRSTIAEDCQIGQMPESVRTLIRGTALEDQKTTLLELAKLPSEAEQLRACQALLHEHGAVTPELIVRVTPRANVEMTAPKTMNIDRNELFDERQGATASMETMVENALQPLEDWLGAAVSSPNAENRFVKSAIALSSYAASLLERTASGIEATHPRAAYAKRARRAARALRQRVVRLTDELVLVTECICVEGCAGCGFARGLAAVDLQREKSHRSATPRDPESGFM